jgi:AcrR family transcriptional regulator
MEIPTMATTTLSSPKRLAKADRREQLLDTAVAIVRELGTDGLTLGLLAERAGVSKPIAYEHFGTRAGLLIAMSKRADDRQVEALRQALAAAPGHLPDIARVVARAYMRCYATGGAEWQAVSAALKGTAEMEAFQHELIEGYVQLYADAFAPHASHARKELRARCVAIMGAAEALAAEMLRGALPEARAAAVLEAIVIAAIGPG